MTAKKLARLQSIAIEKVKENTTNRCKHVAFILKGNKVVSIGMNQLKTDTFAYKLYEYPYIHAEANAIKMCPRNIDLTKCTLVNFRIGHGDRLLMSKPCRGCTSLIDSAGIKKVYYSDRDGKIVEL